MQDQGQNKQLYIIGGIATVIIIVGIVMMSIASVRNRNTGVIEVQAKVPTDATAMIDGDKIDVGSEVRVKSGKHKLMVSRKGFTTNTQNITVTTGQDTAIYTIYLQAADQTGQKWLDDHTGSAIELEGSGSRAYDALSAQNTLNNPIVEQLPLIDPQFRIDYGTSESHPNDSNRIGIYIQASDPSGRQAALSLLRDKGFDPSDMELIFVTPQV